MKLAWTAAIFIPAFIIIELRQKEPLVDLRLFARRNFGLGSIVNLALGMGLYGVVFILPLYLGQMHGYDATQIGTVIIWLGLPQLACHSPDTEVDEVCRCANHHRRSAFFFRW